MLVSSLTLDTEPQERRDYEAIVTKSSGFTNTREPKKSRDSNFKFNWIMSSGANTTHDQNTEKTICKIFKWQSKKRL